MTAVIDVEEAGRDLEALVERVRRGEDVVLSKGGEPCAKLVALATAPAPRSGKRQLGLMKGWADEAALGPLTEEELREWEDGPVFPV